MTGSGRADGAMGGGVDDSDDEDDATSSSDFLTIG